LIKLSRNARQCTSLVLYAVFALQTAVQGMTLALRALKDGGDVSETSGLVTSFANRQALVKKEFFDDLENRFSRQDGLFLP
jgi:hypothetical protein